MQRQLLEVWFQLFSNIQQLFHSGSNRNTVGVMAQTSTAEKKKSVSTTSLQALWDSSNRLDVQHSYLTAKQARAEGCRLKIDWGALRGNQLGCSLTLPHKYWDKEEIPATVWFFSNVWQSRSHHAASAVIFYSSSTLQIHISYPCWCASVSGWVYVNVGRELEAGGFQIFKRVV